MSTDLPRGPNARSGKATGPRTPEGRKRASQNACKHGLTSAQRDPSMIADIQALIEAHFCGGPVSPYAVARLAEAEALLHRILTVQQEVAVKLDACLADEAPEQGGGPGTRHGLAQAQDVDDLVEQYRRVARYRAEAEAQRRKALHAVLASVRDAQTTAEGNGHGAQE